MSDPESPSFHRKPFSVETNRFDDANYWRLPIDELDFKESASLSTMGRDFQAMDSEIGVNGTLRGIKRPNKPSVEILKTSLPRIIEIGRAKPIIPAKRHIIPVYEPIIPKFDNSVQKDSQFESKGVLVVDTAADTSTPTPIPSFEDAIDNHKYRLFDYPAVTESIVVVESNTIEQVPKQNSFRSFEARDAYDRRPYRLFDEHDRDAIISIPPRPADHLRISPKLPAEGPRSVLSSESISSIPRKSEFKPQPVIRDKLLSPVTSNTTLGSETGRESIATKKSTKAPKFDKEDLDYNKSNENLKKRFWFKWIM